MELDKIIQSRRSVRKYKSKKPDWQKIIECIDAARYAPMAGNNYTLKFILIEDEKTIQKIADCAQQDFIVKAPYVVVVCSNPRRTLNAYGERGEIYTRQQAGAAIENFLLKIVESGLSACWVGAFVEDQIKRELKIPEEVNIEAVIPVGYEYEKPKTRKHKIDLDRILYFHKYGQSKKKLPKKLNV
jgi:nitroreductase